ncbi:MAG: phospholipase A [Thalassotalea sp.]
MKKVIICWLLIPLFSLAAEQKNLSLSEKLTSHEPNLLGYTRDSDDKELFLDFKVSLKYPIAYDYSKGWCNNKLFESCIPYLAFTGRFGQYISVRKSSPVISKRFNPSLFWRFRFDKKGYIANQTFLNSTEYLELHYGHESNGQRVSSLKSWQSMFVDFVLDGDKGTYANDYISRGWDYWGITYKTSMWENRINTYFSYRNFVGGLLQDDIEEYFTWEKRRDITSRKEINGLKLLIKFQNDEWFNKRLIDEYKFSLILETGIRSSFKYNTIKLEASTEFYDMPVMIWYQRGYGADFAQYFLKTSSFGVSFEVSSF